MHLSWQNFALLFLGMILRKWSEVYINPRQREKIGQSYRTTKRMRSVMNDEAVKTVEETGFDQVEFGLAPLLLGTDVAVVDLTLSPIWFFKEKNLLGGTLRRNTTRTPFSIHWESKFKNFELSLGVEFKWVHYVSTWLFKFYSSSFSWVSALPT